MTWWFLTLIIILIYVYVIILVIQNTLKKQKINQKKLNDLWDSIWNKSITHNWIAVRSTSENYIANFLYNNKIQFEYEKEIFIKWNKLIPDFHLTKFNVFIEYWWEIDEEYKRRRREKQNIYQRNWLKVINIYPNNIWFSNPYSSKKYLSDKILIKILEENWIKINKFSKIFF